MTLASQVIGSNASVALRKDGRSRASSRASVIEMNGNANGGLTPGIIDLLGLNGDDSLLAPIESATFLNCCATPLLYLIQPLNEGSHHWSLRLLSSHRLGVRKGGFILVCTVISFRVTGVRFMLLSLSISSWLAGFRSARIGSFCQSWKHRWWEGRVWTQLATWCEFEGTAK